ncbi:LOW QUALITY PROTEIN: hypothetical protein CVT25_009980, partial [Psilocybe cyanescens]
KAITKLRDQEKKSKDLERVLSQLRNEHEQFKSSFESTVQQRGQEQSATISTLQIRLDELEKRSASMINSLHSEIQTANTTIEGLNQTLKSIGTHHRAHRTSLRNSTTRLLQLATRFKHFSFGNEKRALVAEGEQRIISLQNEMNGLRNRAANDSAEQEKLRQKISRLNDLNNDMSMREKRLQAQQEQALSAAKKEYESQFSELKTSYDTSLRMQLMILHQANVHAQLAQLKARLDSGRGRQNDLESSESQQVQIATSLRTALEQEQKKNKVGLCAV